MSVLKGKSKAKLGTLYIVRVAFMAALLTVGKLALSFIPNVEVVTVLVIVYGSALGIGYVLPSTLIFCAVEIALYGVGTWNALYFVYWPLLGLAACALKGKRLPVAVILAAVFSVFFGFLDAGITTLFVVGKLSPLELEKYFVVYYLRGLYFDLVHVVSSAVTVGVLYLPLVRVLKSVARDAYLKHSLSTRMASLPYIYAREGRGSPDRAL